MPNSGDTKIVKTIIYRCEVSRMIKSTSEAESQRLKNLLMNSTADRFKAITTYKYRNAGRNSGWYIYNVTVTNL